LRLNKATARLARIGPGPSGGTPDRRQQSKGCQEGSHDDPTAAHDLLRGAQPQPQPGLAWKIIDSLFLAFLVVLVVISLVQPFGYVLLVPWVVLATCRSWYAMPTPSKRARRRLREHHIPSEPVNGLGVGGQADVTKQTWDPIER
jgi:Flp pilus assembly protein TadB